MYDLSIEQDVNNSYYNLIFLFIFILILAFLVYISFVNSTKQPRSVAISKADFDNFENQSKHPNLLALGEENTDKPLDYNTLHEYAILENCPKGRCVVDMKSGAKRCPENENISLTFIPTSEVCTNKFTCDYKELPFALRPDNSAVNNSCGVSEPCRCVEFSQCATQVTATFDVLNGSPYSGNSNELNYYFTLNSKNEPFFNKDSLVIKNEELGARFCRLNPAFTDRIINGCQFTGSVSDPIDCANANVYQELKDNTTVNLIPSNYDIPSSEIGKVNDSYLYENYNVGDQTIYIYDESDKNYNIYTNGYFDFTFSGTSYQIHYDGTYVSNFIQKASKNTDGDSILTGDLENYTVVELKNILGRDLTNGGPWQKGFPVLVNYTNSKGDSINPDNVVTMNPINVLYQPCEQDKVTANYKNMLQCVQPLQQPCNFGTLTYNVDQILDTENNITSVYDQENSRNFCRAFNKTRLDSSKVQKFYLNDPGSFTTSCMIGAGCGGAFDDNLCTEDDCSEAINQRKNNFFGNYDASAVQNYWILSNFGPANYPGLQINPANGNTPPSIAITGKSSMFELEPGDYWQRNNPEIIKFLTQEAQINDNFFNLNSVEGLTVGDAVQYLGNSETNVTITSIDTGNKKINISSGIGISIPKGGVIRAIDYLNSNDFGVIAKLNNAFYLMAIDGKTPANLSYSYTINGTLTGEFNSVFYNGTDWVAVGEDKFQNSQSNIWNSSNGNVWAGFKAFGDGGFGNAVYYGNNTWVAAGKNAGATNSNSLYYSTDGIFWTVASQKFPDGSTEVGTLVGQFNAVHFDNNKWVAVGQDQFNDNEANIWISDDGINWEAKNAFGHGGFGNDVYFGNNTWVVVGKNADTDSGGTSANHTLYYSTDNGDNWQLGNIPDFTVEGVLTGQFNAVHYDNNKWIAVGQDQFKDNDTNIWISDNGISWVGRNAFGHGGFGNDVYFGNNTWVVVGQNADLAKNGPNSNVSLYYSTDNGDTWTVASQKFSDGSTGSGTLVGRFNAVHFDNNKWVAVGQDQLNNNEANIWISDDGINWEAKNTFGHGGFGNDVYYGGSNWVVVGQNADLAINGPNSTNSLYYSNDNGETWDIGVINSDGVFKLSSQGIIIYKQFGFNGINYNTQFTSDGIRKYSESFVFNNFIGQGQSFPVYSYIGIPDTTALQAEYSLASFNNENVDFKNLKSMYYPVWNNSNFRQECILCDPAFFAFATVSDNNQIQAAQIQFSGQQFFNYAHWQPDNNYVYTSFTKIVAANSNTNFLVMENINTNIAVGDYIIDASGLLERNLVSNNPSSKGTINVKQSIISDNNIQSYTPTSFFEPFIIVDKLGNKNTIIANGSTANYVNGQYKINFENNSQNFFMGKIYSDDDNNLYEIVPVVKVVDIVENNVIITDANVNLTYENEENFFIQTIKKDESLQLIVEQDIDNPANATGKGAAISVDQISRGRITNINIDNIGSNYSIENKPVILISNYYSGEEINYLIQ